MFITSPLLLSSLLILCSTTVFFSRQLTDTRHPVSERSWCYLMFENDVAVQYKTLIRSLQYHTSSSSLSTVEERQTQSSWFVCLFVCLKWVTDSPVLLSSSPLYLINPSFKYCMWRERRCEINVSMTRKKQAEWCQRAVGFHWKLLRRWASSDCGSTKGSNMQPSTTSGQRVKESLLLSSKCFSWNWPGWKHLS